MIIKKYVILAPEGIHARPATALIRLTKTFKSVFSLRKAEQTIRLNSMLNILSLGAKGGDQIEVIIDGEDELAAGEALDLFFHEQMKDL